MDLFDKHIINRSKRAIKCLSLSTEFYKDAEVSGLSASKVLQMKKKYISRNLFSFTNPEKIEACFLWLIKIGILRREVDGQGLTSKVRLTPLGTFILKNEPDLANQKASAYELIRNWILRNLFTS
ncbi:Npun_F0494 family protein [Prochlorococcus marinus]|uniref:Npun_F0494 family protein n=1 Tax=Prochlorococcus marinus TaxID=1219 RepID=UPI0022B4967F|nr:Npun_F0494 family protein [Prochlorococcus marinus]